MFGFRAANDAPRRARPLRALLACGSAALAICGCSTIQQMFLADKASAQRAEQLQIQQFRVMRFADEYVGGIIEPLQRFQASTDNADDRLAAQNWKLSQSTAAYTIASGPSAVANTLDMIVLATLSRMVVEDAWITERFGERATPLRDAHRRLEAQARELATGAITAEQFAQLQSIIDEWRKKNPHINAVSYVHFSDFAKSIGHPTASEHGSAGGLFALLGIDPLSNLDPAVREIAQSRELAERTIYYAQRAAEPCRHAGPAGCGPVCNDPGNKAPARKHRYGNPGRGSHRPLRRRAARPCSRRNAKPRSGSSWTRSRWRPRARGSW